jgi:hypothetical protein
MSNRGLSVVGVAVAVAVAAGVIYLWETGRIKIPGFYTIKITPSTTTLPSTGGPVTISGVTNEPDGTTIYLFQNAQPVSTTTVSGGAFGFTVTLPPNTGSTNVTYTFFASDNPSGT